MNKKKIDPIVDFGILTFFFVIVIASLGLDIGAYFANNMAIEFVNRDVDYLKNMQGALKEIPSLEKPILIQQCQSILISSVQDRFSFFSLATIFLMILALFIFRKKITKFDNEPGNLWLIFKHVRRTSVFLIPICIATASMFFGFAIITEQSQEKSIGQALSGITGNATGQGDKLLLLETQLFDTSQTYFKNLQFGFYIVILGISFFVSYIIQFLKKRPNMLSSIIFYGTIIAFVYLSLLFFTLPVKSYSNFVGSDEFKTGCENLIVSQKQIIEEPDTGESILQKNNFLMVS